MLCMAHLGFRLEELVSQGNMVDSELKQAVDEASRLMERFGEVDDELRGGGRKP
jgi:hypothetical protein